LNLASQHSYRLGNKIQKQLPKWRPNSWPFWGDCLSRVVTKN